jgi:ABC-type antimicrobial peptide transport system, permease component
VTSLFHGNFALRTNVDPAAVVSEIRRAVRDLTGAVTVERFVTIQDEIDASIVPERIMGLLSGFLGAIGGLLAAFGLYGLLAYTVACRTTDIGVRMALGATRGEMIRMVLRDAPEMTGAGLTIGIVAAYCGNRLAGHVIQDLPVQSAAPVVFAALAMFAVAALAAYLPAHRAVKSIPWSPCAMNNSDSTLRSVDCHGQASYSMLHFFMYVSSRYHSAARYRQSAESSVALTPLASISISILTKITEGHRALPNFAFPSSIFQIGGPHDSTQKS